MRTPAGARQPPLIQRLPDAPFLEAVLNELRYSADSALAESLSLGNDTARDSFHTSDRRLSTPRALPCCGFALAAGALASGSTLLGRGLAPGSAALASGGALLCRRRAPAAGTLACSGALSSRGLTTTALAPAALPPGRSGTLSTS